MIEIDVADRQDRLELGEAWCRGLLAGALAAEGVAHAALSVALVDNGQIHELNRRFLDHDWPTDVITFPLSEPDETPLVGEIVISTEHAIERAAEFGWSPVQEAGLYLIHGVLHLVGYDDKTPQEAERMNRRQTELAARLLAPLDARPEVDPAC